MATMKHTSSKNSSYQSTLNYLEFESDKHGKLLEDKNGFYIRRQGVLMDTMNTTLDTWSIDCINTNKKYNKNQKMNDIKQHQYIISFDPKDDLTPQQAMQIGKKLAETFFPGHECLLAVHPDGRNHSENIHVHIVINSVRAYAEEQNRKWQERKADYLAGCKHRSTAKFTHRFKEYIMNKCKELGLNQIDLLNHSKEKITENEYWIKKNHKEKDILTKDKLREILISVSFKSSDLNDYKIKLELSGIKVSSSRNKTVFHFEGKKFRTRSLGSNYDLDIISKNFILEKYLETQKSFQKIIDAANNVDNSLSIKPKEWKNNNLVPAKQKLINRKTMGNQYQALNRNTNKALSDKNK